MDIATIWNQTLGVADWSIDGPQLASGSDLESAVLISLFTDRQATGDDAQRLQLADPRGWWGDTGEDHPIGSRLWLRRRAKATAQTLQDVRSDILEALQWMLDDGVVARLEVTTEWTRMSMLGALIVLHRTDGQAVTLNYAWAWQGVS